MIRWRHVRRDNADTATLLEENDLSQDPAAALELVDLVREAMEKALPGATKIMNFTRDIAEILADAGKTQWMHSPTCFSRGGGTE